MIAIANAIKGSFKGIQYPNDELKLYIDSDGKICTKTYNLSSNIAVENWEEMKMISKLSSIKNKFLVAVLSPTAEQSKDLKFDDWNKMAEDYAKKFGFINNQFRWDVHGNTDEKHLHIYASRIDFSGKNKVIEGRIGMRSGEWAEIYSKSVGWKTLDELTAEKKNNIKSILQDVLKTANNFQDLKANLDKVGLTFQLSYSNKTDGSKTLNGMRIMTKNDAEKREIRENATQLAVDKGKTLLSESIRNKPKLSPDEIEMAKELGKPFLLDEMQELVLTKAQFRAKPGFTLSELAKNKNDRISIGDIVLKFEQNSTNPLNQDFDNTTESKKVNLKQNENGFVAEMVDILLKNNYSSASSDELLRRKKKNQKSFFSR